ncbi:MAG: (Fe-S)-binding protein [Acidimicrobiales bacterium]|nr:(Fe-S)-binding protein [Acidimicrobiales bacterium]
MTDESPLRLRPEELVTCVSCGLCLPHCPTFRTTGEELLSPRGRVAAMRQVQDHGAPVDGSFLRSIDTCVQCRGCETACPSGVPFGHLMEDAKAALVQSGRHRPPAWLRAGLRGLSHPRLLVAGARAVAVAQRLRLVPSARFGLPRRLPLRSPALQPSGTDVVLFTGCVMDAVQRDIHHAAKRVVESTGVGVALMGDGGSCCGALHVHAGLRDDAGRLARKVIDAAPADLPVLVDSAGCGAALKEYERLLGTDAARAFSARVHDIHEWLAARLHQLPEPRAGWVRPVVAVQDPCHLRHVQRCHLAVREVLAPYADVVELADDGLCCGAGGSYSFLQPELAVDIRDRKVAALRATGARVVVSANPGCSMHLSAGGVDVRHPLEIVADAIG